MRKAISSSPVRDKRKWAKPLARAAGPAEEATPGASGRHVTARSSRYDEGGRDEDDNDDDVAGASNRLSRAGKRVVGKVAGIEAIVGKGYKGEGQKKKKASVCVCMVSYEKNARLTVDACHDAIN